jgi:hypothetical protein
LLQGGERHEAFTYPDEQWTYYAFADKFGWTPDQVDNSPASTADWLLSITAPDRRSEGREVRKRVMSARITITNLSDVLAGFQATEDKIELAVQYAISMTGLAVERQAKANASGRLT